jgi:hypothetical protein
VFVNVTHFYPSLIFIDKIRVDKYSTRVGFNLACKFWTRGKCFTVANNLDYYGAKIITALKILLNQAEEANTV